MCRAVAHAVISSELYSGKVTLKPRFLYFSSTLCEDFLCLAINKSRDVFVNRTYRTRKLDPLGSSNLPHFRNFSKHQPLCDQGQVLQKSTSLLHFYIHHSQRSIMPTLPQ